LDYGPTSRHSNYLPPQLAPAAALAYGGHAFPRGFGGSGSEAQARTHDDHFSIW